MDRKMMNAWLAAQAQKQELTTTRMQQKRLGIKEGVNYGDINFRVPVDTDIGKYQFVPYSLMEPRSPESAANLTRRLENLYMALADPKTPSDTRTRIANMLMAKGVAPEGSGRKLRDDPWRHNDVVGDLIKAAEEGKSVTANELSPQGRQVADSAQVQLSRNTKENALRAKRAAANRIGGSKLPKALGPLGVALGLATGANAEDVMVGLHPLSIFGDSPAGLGSDLSFEYKPYNPGPLVSDEEAAGPKLGKPSAKKINENNMMNAWLQGQAQKQELTTTRMQQKRLGITEEIRYRKYLGPNPPDLLKRPPEYEILPSAPQYDPNVSGDGVPRMLDRDLNSLRMRIVEPVPGEYEEGKGPLSHETLNQNKQILIQKRLKDAGIDFSRYNPKDTSRMPLRVDGVRLQEQLNAEEEAYAKSHKSMLAGMIKQYGKEKGTRVFYASVRNAVKKKD